MAKNKSGNLATSTTIESHAYDNLCGCWDCNDKRHCGPITYEVLTARLASVTSAFLVLKHDPTITGGAKKLIEKECELLSTGESGAPMIRELRKLRDENARLVAQLDTIFAQARHPA